MNGQEIIDEILRQAEVHGYESAEARYAQVVLTAIGRIDKSTLYAMLETAHRTGQRLELYSSVPYDQGYSEPQVRLTALPVLV